MRPALYFCAVFMMLAMSCQCSLTSLQSNKAINIVSYNVHNLFDAEESGNEYPEFKPSKGTWTKELYAKRLDNTVHAVKSFAAGGRLADQHTNVPDILCLQEIENQKVLADLAEHFGRGIYRYWAIGGPQDGIIHTGILSRFPIVTLRTHSVCDAWGFGPMRDILEAELQCGDMGSIVVFVCHWKSKMEGSKETEPARQAAAALLVDRLHSLQAERPDLPVVVCGDFNESPDEYIRVQRAYPTAIMLDGAGAGPPASEGEPLRVSDSWDVLASPSADPEKVILYNVWTEQPDGFSIAYQDAREQFDSFFINAPCHDGQGIEFKGFRVADDPELVSEDGTPFVWRGSQGFSDHLPVELCLSFGGM